MSQVVRSDLKVRPCLPEDADRVLNVHRSAICGTAAPHYPDEVIQEWASPITSEKIKAFADSTLKGEETRFVAELDGQIVGVGAIVESLSELRAVYVSPNFGRVGVGTTILREARKARPLSWAV